MGELRFVTILVRTFGPYKCENMQTYHTESYVLHMALFQSTSSRAVPLCFFKSGMSKLFHKGPCGCRFSFQPSSSTPDLTHLINWSQLSESWSNCVLLTVWSKNLQRHGPLWNSLDMPALNKSVTCLMPYYITHWDLFCLCLVVFSCFSRNSG